MIVKIPLCQLCTWEAVWPTGFSADIDQIKEACKRDSYIASMAPLYVTTTNQKESILPFSHEDREVLDLFWKMLSDEWDELMQSRRFASCSERFKWVVCVNNYLLPLKLQLGHSLRVPKPRQ